MFNNIIEVVEKFSVTVSAVPAPFPPLTAVAELCFVFCLQAKGAFFLPAGFRFVNRHIAVFASTAPAGSPEPAGIHPSYLPYTCNVQALFIDHELDEL